MCITAVTIDKAERIVLPKPIRDELQLSPGDALEVDSSEERLILCPLQGSSRIYKKQGGWVMHGVAPLSVDVVEKTMQQIRREREQSFLGKQT
jgi:AbrB family looped-hinge helix DNA binding protein